MNSMMMKIIGGLVSKVEPDHYLKTSLSKAQK